MKWYNINSHCVPGVIGPGHAGFRTARKKNNYVRIFIIIKINNLLINLQCYYRATMTHRIKRVFICISVNCSRQSSLDATRCSLVISRSFLRRDWQLEAGARNNRNFNAHNPCRLGCTPAATNQWPRTQQLVRCNLWCQAPTWDPEGLIG